MKILPDGNVEIRNKRTGETKVVSPDDLPSFGISYSTYESELKAAQNVGIAPKSETPSELSDAQKGDQVLAKAGLRALKKVQELYKEDPSVLTKQLTPGKFQSRTFDSALFNAVNALLRIQTGATAPEDEVRRYMSNLGPNFGDKPEDVQFKITQLRTDLTEQGYIPQEDADKLFPGEELGDSSQYPAGSIVKSRSNPSEMSQTLPPITNPIDRALQPVARGPVGDVADAFLGTIFPGVHKVADKSGKGENVSAGNLAEAGGDLLATTLPAIKLGKLGLAAKGALAGGVRGVTRDEKSPGERIVEGGKEALLGGVLGGAAQLPKIAIGNLSFKSIGNQRNAAVDAAKTAKVSGDKIAAAAREYIEHDPMAKNVANKILPSIEKKLITVPNLMKKIDVWNDAYTQAGRVGKSAEAGVNNALARRAKELLGEIAPEVAKTNKKFSRAYAARDIGKKFINPITIGTGIAGAAGTYLASKLLGGR